MAHVYVYSGAAGAGTGADWANAYTTLAAALNAKAAGDNFWVAHDDAESQASSITLTSPGTLANPCRIQCVNRAGSVPPVAADLATTATIKATTSANIVRGGVAYVRGIQFTCTDATGSGSFVDSSVAATNWTMENCILAMAGSNAGAAGVGNGSTATLGSSLRLKNCTMTFGAAGTTFRVCGIFLMEGGSICATGTVLTTLFAAANANTGAEIRLRGVDLSAFTSGKTLVAAMSIPFPVYIENCKLGASVTLAATPTGKASRINFVRCDSGNTNYVDTLITFYGTKTVETTIVLSGGATDGTTPISHKIVASGNSWIAPFYDDPIVFWNETVGSAIIITLQGIWGGGAVPNNDDIWIEVEYLGTSSLPLSLFATSGKASDLATGSALSAGAGTWGGSTTKFKMAVTVTPQVKGPVQIRVCCGSANTFYVDPKPVIT